MQVRNTTLSYRLPKVYRLNVLVIILFFTLAPLLQSKTNFNNPNLCDAEITGLFFEDLIGDDHLEVIDGMVYYTTELPGLFRLMANTSGQAESLKFSISGPINIFHTENFPPYTYPGGNPTALDFPPGTYIVNLMLFSQDHLGGEMCDQLTLTFTIIEQCFIEEAFMQATDGSAPISFDNGAVFCGADLPAETSFGVEMAGTHESVRFEISFNGSLIGSDVATTEPYTSDTYTLQPGTYTITAIGFGVDNPKVTPCNERTYTLVVEDCGDNCPTATFDGGEINAGECMGSQITVDNTTDPFYEAQDLEVVWITSNSGTDCGNSAFELIGIDLASIYDNFIAAGGYGVADPNLAGTSWRFVHDNNLNDFQLTVDAYTGTGCYIRFARVAGCETFYGKAGPVFINGEDCTGCNESIDGGAITAGGCSDNSEVLVNNIAAPQANGYALETIWIQSTNDDCASAEAELSTVNIGLAFNAFLAAGGFSGASPVITGTSWTFVRDNNGDDLQLSVSGLAGTACFMRLSRIQGCEDFDGQAGPIFIDGQECVDCNFAFNGGTITAGDCNETGSFIIANTVSPDAGGLPVESIWLGSTNGDCDAASGELAPLNVGELYDAFLAAGGFGVADPTLPGTSWQFMTDMDGDDLVLVVNQMEGEGCFTRCTRLIGCQGLMGESNLVSVSCVSTLDDPVTFDICEHVISLEGITENSTYFVKVYQEGYGDIIFENNSFSGDFAELTDISLPDGPYILDVLLLEGAEFYNFRLTEKIYIPTQCIDPLAENPGNSIDLNQMERVRTGMNLEIYPNPVNSDITFVSNAFVSQNVEVQVINSLGQVLLRKETTSSAQKIGMIVDDLENGIYFAQFIINGKPEFSGRFIVNK